VGRPYPYWRLTWKDTMDLATLLDDVTRWRLTNCGWQRVDDALLLLDEALGAGDEEHIRQATTALILAGPRRAGQGVNEAMDQPPRQPTSARTQDLVNRLLHRLGRHNPDAPRPAPQHRDGDDTT